MALANPPQTNSSYGAGKTYSDMARNLAQLAPLFEVAISLLKRHQFPSAVRVRRASPTELSVWLVEGGPKPTKKSFKTADRCEFVFNAWTMLYGGLKYVLFCWRGRHFGGLTPAKILCCSIFWPAFRTSGADAASAREILERFDSGHETREAVEAEFHAAVMGMMRTIVTHLEISATKAPLSAVRVR